MPEGSDITSVDDLAGKIVGAQDATTGETYANDETDASEVRGFPEGPDAIAAVTTGQVDAAIIDEPVAVDAVAQVTGRRDREPDPDQRALRNRGLEGKPGTARRGQQRAPAR